MQICSLNSQVGYRSSDLCNFLPFSGLYRDLGRVTKRGHAPAVLERIFIFLPYKQLIFSVAGRDVLKWNLKSTQEHLQPDGGGALIPRHRSMKTRNCRR